jgi:hypothetical protein
MYTLTFASFAYAFLATFVLRRLIRRRGAQGREERILIVLGWFLVGVSAGAVLLFLILVAVALST